MVAASALRAVITGPLDGFTIEALRAVVLEAPNGVRLTFEDAPATLQIRPDPSIATLIDKVAHETGISAARIRGAGRDAPAVRARNAVCWAAKELLGRGLSETGQNLGRRDHSTIRNAILRAEELQRRDPAFRGLTARLRRFVEEQDA